VAVRGDPHGKISDRGCVVDRETVALDEWLIVLLHLLFTTD
jgi:hypothetical protein